MAILTESEYLAQLRKQVSALLAAMNQNADLGPFMDKRIGALQRELEEFSEEIN